MLRFLQFLCDIFTWRAIRYTLVAAVVMIGSVVSANSTYTDAASSATSCPWACNSGYGQNYANNCVALCAAGFGTLRTSTGVSVPLYASAVTSPAIHIKAANGTMCYGNLQSGSASGAINVKHNDITYHTVQ